MKEGVTFDLGVKGLGGLGICSPRTVFEIKFGHYRGICMEGEFVWRIHY